MPLRVIIFLTLVSVQETLYFKLPIKDTVVFLQTEKKFDRFCLQVCDFHSLLIFATRNRKMLPSYHLLLPGSSAVIFVHRTYTSCHILVDSYTVFYLVMGLSRSLQDEQIPQHQGWLDCKEQKIFYVNPLITRSDKHANFKTLSYKQAMRIYILIS